MARRSRVLLTLILASSLGLKLALLIPAHGIVPVGDSVEYVSGGHELATRGVLGTNRAPLYPASLGAIFWAAARIGIPTPTVRAVRAGRSAGVSGLDVARLVQILWSTVTVWLVYRLGRELFDARAGLAAAAIAAFYPSFVGFSHLLWSEALYTMLMVAAVLLLVRGERSARLRTVVGAGVCWGLAALTRQIGVTLVPVAVGWIWLAPPRAWGAAGRRTAAFILGVALVVAPWTARNVARYDALVLVTPRSSQALLWGASDDVLGELRELKIRWLPPMEKERLARARALEIITGDPLAWLRRCLTVNLPTLWNLAFDGIVYHLLVPGGYGEMPRLVVQAVIVAEVASYVALMITAIVGMALAPCRRTTLLVVGLVLAYSATHAIAFALPRHRLPLMAFACVYAGFVLSLRRADLARLCTWPRVFCAVAACGAFTTVVALADHTPMAAAWNRARGKSAAGLVDSSDAPE
jgi:hypothetical protein